MAYWFSSAQSWAQIGKTESQTQVERPKSKTELVSLPSLSFDVQLKGNATFCCRKYSQLTFRMQLKSPFDGHQIADSSAARVLTLLQCLHKCQSQEVVAFKWKNFNTMRWNEQIQQQQQQQHLQQWEQQQMENISTQTVDWNKRAA